MDVFWVVYMAAIGAVLGSFYNVVGMRTPISEPFTTGRSHCPHCQRRLSGLDLIPVVSWLLLRGKCRTCGRAISPVYPLTEAVTAFLFAYSYYVFGFSAELAAALIFVSLLVIITVSDLYYYVIPDRVLIFFAVPVAAVRLVIAPLDPWWLAIAGAVIGFSLLYILAVISNGGMGGGDIKLYAVIGPVLGVTGTLLSLFFAALIGLTVSLVFLGRKMTRKTAVPFGPFIACGALIAYFWGEQFLVFYLETFLYSRL
ncbi:prepilin peptidase [Salisediminibacterium halotolerans]|uniref:Leader peptidase (Prepilin peptidase) / N-methyltransferase n=1 Tax=Salisediminibacterium halotolerans TaxID=517425 RepID=A0A1H9R3V1_9BACI|nr:A24 family peptidase [Salisediminibacterium haloalkalitolerans]SER67307.1 leader peptidase (prepilin peptidase) / N-methyltransferase [Salisediminibacterium haloalkalitolerans]